MPKSVPKQTPAARLRALINAPDILVLPGVFDGFSTRLVEKMGYTAAFITGSGVSESRLERLPLPVGVSRRRSVTRTLTPVGRLRLTCDNPKCDMR